MMIRKPNFSRLQSAGVALALGLMVTSTAGFAALDKEAEKAFEPVSPTIDQARANILISRQLQFTHFLDQRIDTELSKRVFDAYLDQLDSQRMYFLQGDVDRFSPWRTKRWTSSARAFAPPSIPTPASNVWAGSRPRTPARSLTSSTRLLTSSRA